MLKVKHTKKNITNLYARDRKIKVKLSSCTRYKINL